MCRRRGWWCSSLYPARIKLQISLLRNVRLCRPIQHNLVLAKGRWRFYVAVARRSRSAKLLCTSSPVSAGMGDGLDMLPATQVNSAFVPRESGSQPRGPVPQFLGSWPACPPPRVEILLVVLNALICRLRYHVSQYRSVLFVWISHYCERKSDCTKHNSDLKQGRTIIMGWKYFWGFSTLSRK